VQVGAAQVDRAEDELRLRAVLVIEARERVLQAACRLLVAALLHELGRDAHGIVGRARRRRGGEGDERNEHETGATHGLASFSFARYTWSHWSTWARNASTPCAEQVTSWFILVPVRKSVLARLSTSAM
jgi:hypothetical protein